MLHRKNFAEGDAIQRFSPEVKRMTGRWFSVKKPYVECHGSYRMTHSETSCVSLFEIYRIILDRIY
jgi:hypothetical protein